MFTGIVEAKGTVGECGFGPNGQFGLTVIPSDLEPGWKLGDSIAVNGCCLTVADSSRPGLLYFDVGPETLSHTNIDQLQTGDVVNLEQALRLEDRLGGHLVSGHIDQIGHIEKIQKTPQAWDVTVLLQNGPKSRPLVSKGSICVDGVSLTIASTRANQSTTWFRVSLIPTTIAATRLSAAKEGDKVNIEYDMVEKMVALQTEVYLTTEGPTSSLEN